MLDQIRCDIQARLDELWGEVDKVRRALAALTTRDSEPECSGPAALVASTATPGESVTTSARRAPRTRTSSLPPRPTAPTSAAAAPASVRTAPGATVSTTLSDLAASGAIAKAARGYQLRRGSDTTRKPARPRPSVSTVATSPSPLAAAAGLGRASVSATLSQLAAAIVVCGPWVLRHHAPSTTSRAGSLASCTTEPLAVEIAAVEAQLSADSPTETVEDVRLALIAALEARHVIQR